MGSSKPKAVQAPYQQQQQQTQSYQNTYAPYSIAGTQEAQDYLNTPLDFGDAYNVDPGVGHRTALAEESVNNRYNGDFNSGIPTWIREMNRNKEVRDVQSQGAYESQQAEYANQQGNNAMRTQRTMADLQRRQALLPQILQMSGTSTGSGSGSGYNTQIVQPQPGFWQRAALTAIGGASSLPRFGVGG